MTTVPNPTSSSAQAEPTEPTTLTPCPTWCAVDHNRYPFPGGGFHSGGAPLPIPGSVVRHGLWQQDVPGAVAGVVLDGVLLDATAVRGLAASLVAAADVLEGEQ